MAAGSAQRFSSGRLYSMKRQKRMPKRTPIAFNRCPELSSLFERTIAI